MQGKPLILIADDEEDVRELVALNLRRAGFDVEEAADGISALRLARTRRPKAMVLDIMMPGRDGLRVCEELRRDDELKGMPIIMLTARGMPEDRIAGLETGADDYVSKPFSPKELVLRVQGVMRRADARPGGTVLDVGPFHFDVPAVKVTIDGAAADLTLLEFKLLHLMASKPGTVIGRDTVLRDVWGYADSSRTRTLDTHVKRLREKLGAHADWIQTSRGIGYIFKGPPETPAAEGQGSGAPLTKP